MLLYIMLYIVLAYLMLFAALANAVCLNNASFFFIIDLRKCILFSCFVFVYFIFLFASCTVLLMFVFPNYKFTSLFFIFLIHIFYERSMSSPEK